LADIALNEVLFQSPTVTFGTPCYLSSLARDGVSVQYRSRLWSIVNGSRFRAEKQIEQSLLAVTFMNRPEFTCLGSSASPLPDELELKESLGAFRECVWSKVNILDGIQRAADRDGGTIDILSRERQMWRLKSPGRPRNSSMFGADLVDQLFNSSEKRLARILLLLSHFGKDSDAERVLPRISHEHWPKWWAPLVRESVIS
jgi:hypothetical protein